MANLNESGVREHKIPGKTHWIILTIALFLAALLVNQEAWYFRTSVLPTQTPKPFDGTTLPVLQVAKWTSLGSGEWNASYDQLASSGKLIPLPVYDSEILKMPTDGLGWTSEQDLNIRNSKITFSVPYMGNYELDGTEYSGSHLAVDIKLPMNTPVYAIGNGVVVKATEQSTGFGNHIVIRHDGFPSLSNSSAKETYYSSYSHLSSVNVTENDIVTKGQFIGKSGATGTATTPHLHFQIDNSSAPWHPYWPFTYQDSANAGLSFTESINAGLGKDKALATTINPMLYVQKYMAGFASSSGYQSETTPSAQTTETVNDSNVPTDNFDLPPAGETTNGENVVENVPDIEVEKPEEIAPAKPAVKLEITHDGSFVSGKTETFTVTALDEDGAQVALYRPAEAVYVDVLLGSVEVPSALAPDSFMNGTAQFEALTNGEGAIQLTVTDGSISGQSEVMTGELFTDVSSDDESFKAISFLKDHGVIGGYPDGSFKPENVVSRVEALKFILNGINSDLIGARQLPFADTSAREWYSEYVATGYNRNIVEGYPDSTFKPANTVNRAEFLKMLLTAMDVQVEKVVSEDVYADVSADSWYAPYVKYGKEKNLLVISGNKFKPEEGMTRRETAELIYRTILLKVSGAPKYSSGIKVSDSAASNYFS